MSVRCFTEQRCLCLAVLSFLTSAKCKKSTKFTWYHQRWIHVQEADKVDLLVIFIISRRFAHLFKWASSEQWYTRLRLTEVTRSNSQVVVSACIVFADTRKHSVCPCVLPRQIVGIACYDRSLHIVSTTSGRKLFPPLCSASPIVQVLCKGHHLMAVDANCQLSVWWVSNWRTFDS